MLKKMEKTPAVLAIRSGLVMLIPVLLLGSAMLVFMYFPIAPYQAFVEGVWGGRVFQLLNFLYNATFGMLSVYLAATVSFCYARRLGTERTSLAAPVTSLVCFFIFGGVHVNDFAWEALGVKGVFVAILSALLATKLLGVFTRLFKRRTSGYMGDSDVEFNQSVSLLLPMASVAVLCVVCNAVITGIFRAESIFALFVRGANALFVPLGRSFLSALLLVLVSSVLWFFGIHGSDVLESVTDTLFTPAIDVNMAFVAAGHAPTEIFTKQFFDVFILMGGCGTAICLLLAVLLFSRRRRNRRLCRLAVLPMLFNINELMIFGYPVIYNTTLALPFILTPLVSFLTTYGAMRLGLVPLVTAEVNWTAPVLLSGYMATGSLAGSALQLCNMVIGVLIYRPFVKAYDRRAEAEAQALVTALADAKKESEETLVPVTLTKLADARGTLARSMASDLEFALSEHAPRLYYQPQYDDHGVCVGVEALLRWHHPVYGLIYPPLVIQLAREAGILPKLEEYVLRTAVSDGQRLRRESGYDREISVNISSATMQTEGYMALLRELMGSGAVQPGEICLEVTEQTALVTSEETFRRMKDIRALGYRLAIDDFSMGHTSLTYLQENCFDTVKLDGTLVRDMMGNPRSYDIIKTITALARKLGLSVIAEYVEKAEQVKLLQAADCFQYQGYLFSPAITADALITRLNEAKETPDFRA